MSEAVLSEGAVTLEWRPHGPGKVAWTVNAQGVRRRATPEEVLLFARLERAEARVAELEAEQQAHRKKR